MDAKTTWFGEVLERELAYIRRRRFGPAPPRGAQKTLVGLALSGGGIRSATTNLGVLQTLSKMGILPLVDYLCTVSGGGYIGSCLSTLLSLEAPRQPTDVPKILRHGSTPLFGTDWERFPFNPDTEFGAAQLRHLRTHGSFLVTRKGILARETLRGLGQLFSGTIYHLLIVFLALATLALGYLFFLFTVAGTIDGTLRQLTDPVPVSTAAFERRRELVPAPPFPEPTAETLRQLDAQAPRYVQAVVYQYPGLLDRITSKAAVAWEELRTAGARHFAGYVIATIGFGMLVAAVAFWYLRRQSSVSTFSTAAVTPRPGESVEDAVAVRALTWAGYASLAAIVGWVLIILLAWSPLSRTPAAPLLWLLLPLAAVATLRVTSWCLHVALPRVGRNWTRNLRSFWSAYQALATYALWATVLLAVFPVLVYAFREHEAAVGLSGVAALLVARLLTAVRPREGKAARLPDVVVKWLLGIAIAAGLLLVVVALAAWFVPDFPAGQALSSGNVRELGLWLLAAAIAFVALGTVGDANRLSPHYFYRDRLAEAYLYTDRRVRQKLWLTTLRDCIELPLRHLHCRDEQPEAAPSAPYHLISCAINLAGSRDLTRKDRKSGYFIFSKLFCGSRHTRYLETREYRGGETKLARAITISGAAASSGMGAGTFFAQAFATVLFNLRLGYWMPNPHGPHAGSTRRLNWHFWPMWLWREITMKTDESQRMINLSDGGHTGDNVGIYPLLQRQCKVIIACDAECDPSMSFGSFTEALRHAYIDLGVEVDIDLTMVRQDPQTGMSRSHCAVGLIRYPATPQGEQQPVGYLVYLKNSLTGDEPEPILNYKSNHTAFPHESTADQFFDDAQFESYRALGNHIAEHAFAQWVETRAFRAWSRQARPAARETV